MIFRLTPLACRLCSAPSRQACPGEGVGVVDGDSITVMREGRARSGLWPGSQDTGYLQAGLT
jgi:hypothetical protein